MAYIRREAVKIRPLLGRPDASSACIWRRNRYLSVGSVTAAARRLAAAMPRVRYAFNLCEKLDNFIVASLAALIGRSTIVLPPTRLRYALDELFLDYPESVCLVDSPMAMGHPMMAVGSWLDCGVAVETPSNGSWPELADDHPAAIFFTSGSTGVPQPHVKTWGALVDGASTLMRSIGRPPTGALIVGTVPPQHMFGFETTVMLPLQAGTPVAATRTVFAGDLTAVLDETRESAPSGAWLMTTPLQLRAFHLDRPTLKGIALAIASTMPLEIELARSIERDWQTSVHEIYGCTEGGILAVRRATSATAWTPASGVEFTIGPDGYAHAEGAHIQRRLQLSDRLRQSGSGTQFDLIGRDADVVKIAGKRGSLSGLTHELLSLRGVRDAVVFLPCANAARVAALIVAPARERTDLLKELALRIDSAFLPRPFRLVDQLPRDAAGKLSLDSLRALLVESATQAVLAGPRRLTTQTSFSSDHPVFAGHFPGNPVVPGVLLLGRVAQMLNNVGLGIVECRQAKFLHPVLPEQMMIIRIDIDGGVDAHFEIDVSERIVAAGSLRCTSVATSP
jgi:acyl-coenzyme A synthetase/AMP-(fatty) acid ligase